MKKNDWFIYSLAAFVLVVGFGYLYGVTFLIIPQIGTELAKQILPYFFSLITLIVGYYWGSSKGSQEKNYKILGGKND